MCKYCSHFSFSIAQAPRNRIESDMLQAVLKVSRLKDSAPDFSEGYPFLIRMQHMRLQSEKFFIRL